MAGRMSALAEALESRWMSAASRYGLDVSGLARLTTSHLKGRVLLQGSGAAVQCRRASTAETGGPRSHGRQRCQGSAFKPMLPLIACAATSGDPSCGATGVSEASLQRLGQGGLSSMPKLHLAGRCENETRMCSSDSLFWLPSLILLMSSIRS